jgi:hypothetical protein
VVLLLLWSLPDAAPETAGVWETVRDVRMHPVRHHITHL